MRRGSGWALVSVCAFACVATDRSPPPAPPPNILLILADDLGWRDVAYAGSGFYETPRIDALAAGALRFDAAYSNAPNCAPTRASLWTGRYAPTTGCYTVGSATRDGPARVRRLDPPPNVTTIGPEWITSAERLQEAGYRTGHVGKWHLGSAERGALPRDQGFEFDVAGNQRGHPPGYFAPYGQGARGLPGLERAPDGEYLTRRLTDEALRFLDQDDGRPWFLALSHYAVHSPIQAPSEVTATFQGKAPRDGQHDETYAAMISELDVSVGRLLDALDASGEAGETLVIFTSDNGGVGGYAAEGLQGGAETTSNAPLRGGKGMLTEGGIRVPLLIRPLGGAGQGARSVEPVITVDLHATILAAAGLDHGPATTDGRDLSPLLEDAGGTLDRTSLYWHFPAYLECGREDWRTTPVSVIRHGRHKLLEFFEDDRLALYDLQDDPGEQRDISAKRPEVVKDLHRRLVAWRETMGAALPTPAQ